MYGPDIATIATPVGLVRIEGTADHVTHIAIGPGDGPGIEGAHDPVRRAATQLREYFAGTRTTFDLPLEPLRSPRGTILREAMLAIPYGEVVSYGALAMQHASSARAVGGACRRNPFPIVVPCHRVVSTSGPEHYSAGAGPDTKAWLLAHERDNPTGAS